MRREASGHNGRFASTAGVALKGRVRCSGKLESKRPPSTGLYGRRVVYEHCWQVHRRPVTESNGPAEPNPVDTGRDTSQQAIRRWGNKAWPLVPADCLRSRPALREGDQIEIVVGPDGRLSLERPLRQP